MNTLSLRIKFRPLKIGWCIRNGDVEALQKALRLSHTLWGGRYNPVIPIDDAQQAKQLIRLFRVDVLISPSEEAAVQHIIEGYSWLRKPFMHSLYVEGGFGKLVPQVLALYNAIDLLRKNYSASDVESPIFLYDWDEDDILSTVLLASFGHFPPSEVVGVDYVGLIEDFPAHHRAHLSPQNEIPSDWYRKRTPNWISGLNLQPDYASINAWHLPSPGFYLGNATKFLDVVNYWNLRASDLDLVFYDPALENRLSGIRLDVLKQAKRWQKNRKEERLSIWSKEPGNLIDVGDLGADTGKYILHGDVWTGTSEKVPLMHFGGKGVLAAVGSNFGTTGISFALPERPYLGDPYDSSQHLVASVDFGIGLYGNERETTFAPFLPELNDFYGRNCCLSSDRARVEPHGMGVIVGDHENDLTLLALNVEKLLTRIFSLAGLRAEPSQPGLITQRIIQQIGGLQGSRVFKIRGVRELIERFKPHKGFTRSNAIQIIRQFDQEKGVAEFTKYEDLSIGTRAGQKLSPEDAFLHLLKFGVFRAGLELGCPNCSLNFWLSLDDIRMQTSCEYCGQRFDITPQLRDRGDWRFRRSGLFGKDDDQGGAIPVIMTLQQMATALAGSRFLYSTQTELSLDSPSEPACETDLVVLTQTNNHKVQMVIGECKNRKGIERNDVLNLQRVAGALEAKGIRTYIVFSKLSDFTAEELQLCNLVNAHGTRRLILFTAEELEPYYMYERRAEEFHVSRHGHSLEDMAECTYRIFYHD
jgi:hypothetical protein